MSPDSRPRPPDSLVEHRNEVVRVEVIEEETGEVVRRSRPMPRWKADKVETGLNINLDHDRYAVRIVRVST